MSAEMQPKKPRATKIQPGVEKPSPPKRIRRKKEPIPVLTKEACDIPNGRVLSADVARLTAKREQALELFQHGLGYTRVSRILNISINTARDWSRAFKNGKFRTAPSDNQYHYTEEVKHRAIRLRLQGYTWAEINQATGIPIASIRKWVLAYTESTGKRKQLLVVDK